ncbi:MAG: ribbon-helix-helix domain-containing protein [Deltaproteobacteria bacterium]|nr:ribbon-helix-helix domain-containing protein [Deltaproteobacteria bacterium]
MKTAISIPDLIFEAAEELSHRLGISRSELYAKAISIYIKEHSNDGVTETLNKVYTEETSVVDPVIQNLQFSSVPKDQW